MSKIIKQGKDEYQSWLMPSVQGAHVVNRTIDDNNSISGNLREKKHKQKLKDGFDEGYRDGLLAAEKLITEKEQELVSKLNYFQQLLFTLNEPFEELDQQVEQELVTLAVAIAKQIIRREINIDQGQIMAVIREALEVLPASSRNVKIALHPEDAGVVRELSSVAENNMQWTLVEDPSLMRGGCKVTTSTSQIDASIESRLAAIFSQILGGEREQDQPGT